MPAFRDKMTTDQIWQLTGYVRTSGAYAGKTAASEPQRRDAVPARREPRPCRPWPISPPAEPLNVNRQLAIRRSTRTGRKPRTLHLLFWMFVAVCAVVWVLVMLVLLAGLRRRRGRPVGPMAVRPAIRAPGRHRVGTAAGRDRARRSAR